VPPNRLANLCRSCASVEQLVKPNEAAATGHGVRADAGGSKKDTRPHERRHWDGAGFAVPGVGHGAARTRWRSGPQSPAAIRGRRPRRHRQLQPSWRTIVRATVIGDLRLGGVRWWRSGPRRTTGLLIERISAEAEALRAK